ncbi:hypothetical protein AAVH_20019 [Aphelenchoides avenae]|nr:hypothetical protein AAVH_20019 [Aphelenchus avenae]
MTRQRARQQQLLRPWDSAAAGRERAAKWRIERRREENTHCKRRASDAPQRRGSAATAAAAMCGAIDLRCGAVRRWDSIAAAAAAAVLPAAAAPRCCCRAHQSSIDDASDAFGSN